MMKEAVLATHNVGKIVELNELFAGLSIKLHLPSEFNIKSVDETGTTFIENAIIKARHASKISQLPAIADDSGLTVDALNGEPGIHTARYAGEKATYSQRIAKLVAELDALDTTDRRASFHCAIVFLRHANDPAPMMGYAQWSGEILTAPRGNKGFGYDPIFYVPTHQCSAAELEPAIKNELSHRGRAAQQLFMQLQMVLS